MSDEFDPITPLEGRHVLHAWFRLDRVAWQRLDAAGQEEARAAFSRMVEEIRRQTDTQLLLFSSVGPKADLGLLLVCPDLHALDRHAKALTAAAGAGVLVAVFQWLSLTERSEYTTSEEEFAGELAANEKLKPGSPEFEERLAAFRARMAKYGRDRLYPNLPAWPVVCFYPMSKRRQPGQNWYALDFDARKELMRGHARVGRTYSGRVLQLITGSTGLDAGEWGVTLFARTTSEIKSIVYEMRFDPVSAHYAEFGDFYIGLQMSAEALWQRLGL